MLFLRTIIGLIAAEVSSVAQHYLHIIALIDGCEDPQYQHDGPQTTHQLQPVHVCRRKQMT